MGAENSRTERKSYEERENERLRTDLAIKNALEQQRRMYERKCAQILEATKSQSNNVQKSEQKLHVEVVTRSGPTLPQNQPNLYPNLQPQAQPQVTNYHVQSSAYPAGNQAFMSHGQYPNQPMTPEKPSTSRSINSNVQTANVQSTNAQSSNVQASKIQSPHVQTAPSSNRPSTNSYGSRTQNGNVNFTPPPLKPLPVNPVNNNVQAASNVRKPSTPVKEFQYSPLTPSAPEADDQNVDQENKKAFKYKGARPRDRSQAHPKKQSNNQLVNCVTCSTALVSYIYNCERGHSSCKDCKFKQKPCGLCSSAITNVRNITLESTIEGNNLVAENNNEQRVKCPNAPDGCQLSFKKELMEDHLKECPLRDFVCPLAIKSHDCNWIGKLKQLSNHFKEAHPENCEANVDLEMILMENVDDPYIKKILHFVTIGPFNFLVHLKRDMNKTIYMAVQLYGTQVSAAKWTYEFHVYNKLTPKRKFQYNDTCHSDTVSVQELFDTGKCAVLPTEYAKTFLGNNKLTYKFYLKKNKDFNKTQPKPKYAEQAN